jgi:copper homeostasis protein (lipoprotein)
MKSIFNLSFILFITLGVCSCNNNKPKKEAKTPARVVYHGLYSFGPEVKSFKDCGNGQEYWATDSSAKLELSYSQLNFEKPYEPVYVEIEGKKIKSGKDGMGSEFDSTIVVTKVIKITKEIPENTCN